MTDRGDAYRLFDLYAHAILESIVFLTCVGKYTRAKIFHFCCFTASQNDVVLGHLKGVGCESHGKIHGWGVTGSLVNNDFANRADVRGPKISDPTSVTI